MDARKIVAGLLTSKEAGVRFKVLSGVLGMDASSNDIKKAREDVRSSDRVQLLLNDREACGRFRWAPYSKWYGAHWVLAQIADLGYPTGDECIRPLVESELEWLLSKEHFRHIKNIEGRIRRCTSQEGNAIYACCTLQLEDPRVDELVSRLIQWQWSDGGWNCDKHPEASKSSFHETLIPLRGLIAYERNHPNEAVKKTIRRAAEVFLKRNLFLGERNGQVMDAHFIRLHYPPYWHYDILFGLKVMAEGGLIHDPRCARALDVLEEKMLADGGFPAEERYYRVSSELHENGISPVDWGGCSRKHRNEFVSADALTVLKAAGRVNL
jgi:hypothetical protein